MKQILILMVLIGGMNAWSQKTIDWADIPLSWKDFTPQNSKVNGKTAGVSINTRYSIESTSNAQQVIVKFESRMSQTKAQSYVLRSFLKDASKGAQEDLLRHEKGHLVSAFIKQLWLQDTLNKVKFDPQDFKKQLKDIFAAVEKRGNELDRSYDAETNHSSIVTQQAIWEDRLIKMLNELIKDGKELPWVIEKDIYIKK